MADPTKCRRESTGAGPDFCRPCSDAIADWVPWTGHMEPVEPRHAWWCRALATHRGCDCHMRNRVDSPLSSATVHGEGALAGESREPTRTSCSQQSQDGGAVADADCPTSDGPGRPSGRLSAGEVASAAFPASGPSAKGATAGEVGAVPPVPSPAFPAATRASKQPTAGSRPVVRRLSE